MSAKGLSGKTSFIPKYITIHRFSTKFKIRSCFLMNINRDYVSLETKFCAVCVFLIVPQASQQAFRARIRLFRFARGSQSHYKSRIISKKF